ncbi:MAG: type-4 uracil-DNA glycosylase [Sulfolobaceae archaeon]
MNEIEALRNEVISCKKCNLWRTRKNAVPGYGDPNATIMFIGEAPGATEDEEGKPFVGNAGKLLTKMIQEVLGLTRDQVYITNLVKCRPPGNRDPTDEEIIACKDYLEREISLVRPKLIVTLGNHSTSYIFKKANLPYSSITRVRGKSYSVEILGIKITVFPTYHPAAALYNPKLQLELYNDFKRIRELLGIENKRVTLDVFFKADKDGSGDKK